MNMPTTTSTTHIKKLGSGGFGCTDLVEREGKRFVMKRLKSSAIAEHGRTAIDMFLAESEYLKTLGEHPQIPQYIDSGIDETGPWILQQYIPGPNLSEALTLGGPMSEQGVVWVLQSLLPVVQHIHSAKAIHRDIKPANIIYSEGIYFLVDFGASKKISETVLAKTGTTIGSAGFAAPEQTMGKAIYASDIYSLGVTCINLLTNVDPFTLMNSATGEWDWRSFLVDRTVSKDFGLILDRMIERGTSKRYQTASEVLKALERIDRRIIVMERAKRISDIRQTKVAADISLVSIKTAAQLAFIGGVLWSIGFISNQAYETFLLSPDPVSKTFLSSPEPGSNPIVGQFFVEAGTDPIFPLFFGIALIISLNIAIFLVLLFVKFINGD